MGLISFITGSDNRKQVKKLDAIANKVEAYQEEYKALSEEQLKAKTAEFREHGWKTTTKRSTTFFPKRLRR